MARCEGRVQCEEERVGEVVDWQEHYNSLSEPEKLELWRHMQVAPVRLRKRPFIWRVIATPKVFWGHFRISRNGGSQCWFAMKTAMSMTHIHLFWKGCNHADTKGID